ncbi:DUF2207 domain-containing protein [Pseudocitrobacter cyperus]|uniref:DUF2207 domain-containing protein n=1 Tax=Pseudocitrobacter cyperus TaxID=3112843 RepID=A0ABV0HF13_9ENTR
MLRQVVLCLLCFCVSLSTGYARTVLKPGERYEHISSFDSRASFNADGSMDVEENIEVVALGQTIRCGIFRTFPLVWERADGKSFHVDYQVTSITRDGSIEPYTEDRTAQALTLRIGRSDQTLRPGIYRYLIHYRVKNHFSRFPEWDELYWNVTGNDWAWPISRVSFQLHLPQDTQNLNEEGRDSRIRTIDVYSGQRGAKESDEATILRDGSILTWQPLEKGEGVTVAYTWPRSVLASAPDPEAFSPWMNLLVPDSKTWVLWLPLLVLGSYFLWWYWKNVSAAGLRMPAVVPLHEHPATMTAGYLRFLCQRAYDDLVFSSDVLDLVGKRAVVLTVQKSKDRNVWGNAGKNDFSLTRLADDGRKSLNADDRSLLSALFRGKRKTLNISVPHQERMQQARSAAEKRYRELEDKLFFKWGKALWRGIWLVMLIPLLCAIAFSGKVAALTLPILILVGVGIAQACFTFSSLFRPGARRRISIIVALMVSPFVLALGSILFNVLITAPVPAGYFGAVVLAVIMCLVFARVAPRYTQRGLNELAVAQGLRRYISAAEKHRYETLFPPDQLLTHFESLLPIALALGVGKTWANTFARHLASTRAVSGVYSHADWNTISDFNQCCHSSSSATPSASGGSFSSGSGSGGSGSSGGGSSGGGSGGGGGGGW